MVESFPGFGVLLVLDIRSRWVCGCDQYLEQYLWGKRKESVKVSTDGGQHLPVSVKDDVEVAQVDQAWLEEKEKKR